MRLFLRHQRENLSQNESEIYYFNIVTHFKTNQFQNDHLEIEKFDWSRKIDRTEKKQRTGEHLLNVLEKTKKSIQCSSWYHFIVCCPLRVSLSFSVRSVVWIFFWSGPDFYPVRPSLMFGFKGRVREWARKRKPRLSLNWIRIDPNRVEYVNKSILFISKGPDEIYNL